jgi:hypothetical protein
MAASENLLIRAMQLFRRAAHPSSGRHFSRPYYSQIAGRLESRRPVLLVSSRSA